MSIQDVLARTDIQGYSDADKAIIVGALQSIYATSTGKKIIDDYLLVPNSRIIILFEAFDPVNQDGAGSSAGNGIVWYDIAYSENTAYLDANGVAIAETVAGTLAHELVHALTGRIDNWESYFDNSGETVEKSNEIFSQLGLTPQLSYVGAGYLDTLDVGRDYAQGQHIDRAWVTDHFTNSLSRVSPNDGARDLLIGGIGQDSLNSGDGNDIIISGGGDDVLRGGSGNDTIYGEAGDDDIIGGDNNDLLVGGVGADTIDGGDGIDVLDFSDAASAGIEDGIVLGVDLSLISGFGGEADGDVYSNIEAVLGSAHSDFFEIGSTGGIFAGGASTDVFDIVELPSGPAPAVVWGGDGADYYYIESEATDPAGILVANVDNLTEANFHLFDYQSLSGVDWDLIDVVILNPDSDDNIFVNGKLIGTGSSTIFANGSDPLDATNDIPYGHATVQTSAHYQQPFVTPSNTAEVVTTYSTGFWSGSVYAAAARITYTSVSRNRPAENEPENEVYTGTHTYDASTADATYTLLFDANGDDPCPEGECGDGLTAHDNYAWRHYDYFQDGQLVSGTSTDGDGITTFLTDIDDIPTPADVDDIGEWFLVGANFNGATFSANGSYSTSLSNPDGSEGGESGSNQTNYNGSSGGAGTTTTYSGFVPAASVFVMGGAPVNPNAPAAGTTISQNGTDVLISSSAGDIVLQDVDLTAWQTAAQAQILGTTAAETVQATSSDDIITSGSGDDTVYAKAGNDTIAYVSGNDVIESGNTGADTLDLSQYYSGQVSFRVDGHDILIDTPDGTIELDYQARHELGHSDSNIETLILADQTLDDAGIRARALADQSTFGDDAVAGTYQDDVFFDGIGDDTIDAWYGDDTIMYVSGDDVIERGNYGADTLDLSQYASDEVSFRVDVYDVFIETPHGTIELDYQVRFGLGHAQSNIETLIFSDVTLDEAGIRARALADQSTTGDDVIIGSYEDDAIIDEAGNDTINANAGDDTITYASGNDVISRNNTGADTLDLSQYTADQVSFRNSGHDVLIDTPDGIIELDYQVRHDVGHADSNIETLIFSDQTLDDAGIRSRAMTDPSTAGDDSIAGSYHDDVFVDAAGNDTIDAWYGDDTIDYVSGDDVIERGNYGADTLDLSQYTSDQVTFSIDGHDVFIDTPDGTIELDYQTRFDLGHSQSNIETLVFSDVTLDEASIRQRALDDQNTSGDDVVSGSAFDDLIVGGLGNDTLEGNDGADTFNFVPGNGLDVISDFVDGLDLIRFTGGPTGFADLTITDLNGDAVVDYGAGDSITLSNVASSLLTQDNFEFV